MTSRSIKVKAKTHEILLMEKKIHKVSIAQQIEDLLKKKYEKK